MLQHEVNGKTWQMWNESLVLKKVILRVGEQRFCLSFLLL